MKHQPTDQQINRLRNTVPSRQKAVDLQRIALFLDGDDAELLNRISEFLLDARQALRGGERSIPVKNWNKT